MKSTTKISWRKVMQVAFTLVITACCIVATVSASHIEGEQKVHGVSIVIKNVKKYHFIEQKEVTDQLFTNKHIDIGNTMLSSLDIRTMEHTLLANPWVASAEVYIDNERLLHVNISQRVPIARIFWQDGKSFYIDTGLNVMPVTRNYVYYTTVFTNFPVGIADSTARIMKGQIAALSTAIQADSFWNAQIAEIILDSAGGFDFVPVLGTQQIVFGDTTNMRQKFGNLFTFYKQVLNRIGWDKYQRLDVRFSNQVVASPSLPYKGPVDKAVVTMNWIDALVEANAANDDNTNDSVAEKTTPTKPADAKKLAVHGNDKHTPLPAHGKILHNSLAARPHVLNKKLPKPPIRENKKGNKAPHQVALKKKPDGRSPRYVYPGN